MASIIRLALGAFISRHRGKCLTKCLEAHEHNQQFGENACIDIGKSQRLRKEGNARINKVLTIRWDLAKLIEKLHIAKSYGYAVTGLHIEENDYWIDYTYTNLSERDHWLSTSQSMSWSAINYECESPVHFDTGVAWVYSPLISIHSQGAQESNTLSIPVTHHYGWLIDHCQVPCWSFQFALRLDPVEVEKAYGDSPSTVSQVQGHVWSSGWPCVSFNSAEYSLGERLILCN